MVAKFVYHLPLYRVYEQLIAAGFKLSRPWLTQLMQQGHRAAEPIYAARIRLDPRRARDRHVNAHQAGQNGAGHMKLRLLLAGVWRGARSVLPVLRQSPRRVRQAGDRRARATTGAVLLSDGYSAYSAYAQMGVTRAVLGARGGTGVRAGISDH
ncbi:MAG: transposase [Rhodocyclaceae bacterium]|nr:transposase [Rhodocyclaceae bacterium]